jgi:cell division septation protein DedD
VVATVSSLPAETTAAPLRTAPASRTTPRRTQTATPSPRNSPQTPATIRRGQTNTASRTATATTRAANPRQANPARIWVQLGVSNNRAGFGYEMTRMRRAAAELRTQTAYTATLGGNHRLLVGPFPTDAAARTFINNLRQKDIPSLAWTSSAGTQVERLPAGR